MVTYIIKKADGTQLAISTNVNEKLNIKEADDSDLELLLTEE